MVTTGYSQHNTPNKW